MTRIILQFLLPAIFLFTLSAITQSQQTDWRKTYLSDIEATRETISANHPGMVDKQNPNFARTMELAHKEALTTASSVKDYNSYRIALTRFANRFQDEHLSVSFKEPFAEIKEAGIYPVYQNGSFIIQEIDERYGSQSNQLRGAILKDCNGRSANKLFQERVLSWRGRDSIEADWYKLAPLLFVDYGLNSSLPNTCRFLVNGRTIRLPLKWNPTTGQKIEERLKQFTSFENRQLSLELHEGGDALWVNIPTFAVNEKEEVAAMHSLIESLKNELEQNKNWDLLIFDLRGNSGGSSVWGDQIARIVFGEEWAKQVRNYLGDGVYTEWRVSEDNINALKGIVQQQEKRHGVDSDNAKFFRSFAESMTTALKNNQSFVTNQVVSRQGVQAPKEVSLPGKIVLLTGASCFSACLDFLDRMRLHPKVVQVGQPTGVDTVYMENWGKQLPSKLGQINYPMKVYRNRKRGNNEAYIPHVSYTGQLNDTTAIRSWILQNYKRW